MKIVNTDEVFGTRNREADGISAAEMLKKFCYWQKRNNPHEPSPEHHDAALLLTRSLHLSSFLSSVLFSDTDFIMCSLLFIVPFSYLNWLFPGKICVTIREQNVVTLWVLPNSAECVLPDPLVLLSRTMDWQLHSPSHMKLVTCEYSFFKASLDNIPTHNRRPLSNLLCTLRTTCAHDVHTPTLQNPSRQCPSIPT